MSATGDRVVVVGASLAGLAFVQAVRREGYAGELVVVGAELHRPYDRPPLSKDLLLGRIGVGDLSLEGPDDDLDVEWRLGQPAVSLDVEQRSVALTDGSQVTGDVVVIATGGRARTLADVLGQEAPPRGGVHTLRTVDDAEALRADLAAGGRLVVLGGGFIGCEVAAAARQLGLEVDVVEAASAPLALALGHEVGSALGAAHERHGVRVHTDVPVTSLLGDDGVTEVLLGDDRRLPADTVLVALGAAPEVGWLADSGLELAGGVHCDEVGRAAPGILAVGDCAAWLDPTTGQHRRVEHWTDARVRAAALARMVVQPREPVPPLPVPYVWSDQYDLRIQYAGRHSPGDAFEIEQGSVETGDLLGVYVHQDVPVAVLGINRPREFGRWRRRFATSVQQPTNVPQPTPTS